MPLGLYRVYSAAYLLAVPVPHAHAVVFRRRADPGLHGVQLDLPNLLRGRQERADMHHCGYKSGEMKEIANLPRKPKLVGEWI